MKTIKALLIAAFTVATLSAAQAQIQLPPPPPHPAHPPLPRIHLNTPPPPPRPGRVVVTEHRRGHVVRRHVRHRRHR